MGEFEPKMEQKRINKLKIERLKSRSMTFFFLGAPTLAEGVTGWGKDYQCPWRALGPFFWQRNALFFSGFVSVCCPASCFLSLVPHGWETQYLPREDHCEEGGTPTKHPGGSESKLPGHRLDNASRDVWTLKISRQTGIEFFGFESEGSWNSHFVCSIESVFSGLGGNLDSLVPQRSSWGCYWGVSWVMRSECVHG